MRVLWVLALTILVDASTTYAGHEMTTQAFQPFEIDGPGLILVETVFVAFGSYWDSPGAEVLQTVAPGRAANDPHDRNRNAANKAGIGFTLLPGAPDSTNQVCPGLVGDTLRVRVDLEQSVSVWSLDELVSLTLKCGLYNAKRRWPRVRHLEYEVVGNPRYAAYSGRYDLEEIEIPRGPVQDLTGLAPPDTR